MAADGSGLFTKTYDEWAAQSGVTGGSINDHAYQALLGLTGLSSGALNDLMFFYLGGLGLTGGLSDMLFAWDGVFAAGSSADELLLVDGSSFFLLVDGTSTLLLN